MIMIISKNMMIKTFSVVKVCTLPTFTNNYNQLYYSNTYSTISNVKILV